MIYVLKDSSRLRAESYLITLVRSAGAIPLTSSWNATSLQPMTRAKYRTGGAGQHRWVERCRSHLAVAGPPGQGVARKIQDRLRRQRWYARTFSSGSRVSIGRGVRVNQVRSCSRDAGRITALSLCLAALHRLIDIAERLLAVHARGITENGVLGMTFLLFSVKAFYIVESRSLLLPDICFI